MTEIVGPIVIKLGGSFAFSENLREWIEACAACAGRVVIVPGGGPFADAVRSAQPKMGFDDVAAHQMSVLGMEQYGRALASYNSLLSLADSTDAIRRHLTAKRVPVWMPTRMVLDAADITPSWGVTSDSLAAWLSGRIGAVRLLLVKHFELAGGHERSESLAGAGIVDQAFPRFFKMSSVPSFILGPADHQSAVAAIRNDATVGLLVE